MILMWVPSASSFLSLPTISPLPLYLYFFFYSIVLSFFFLKFSLHTHTCFGSFYLALSMSLLITLKKKLPIFTLHY